MCTRAHCFVAKLYGLYLFPCWATQQRGGHRAICICHTTVEEITGTPARTFLDWLTDNVKEFQA